VVFSKLLGWMVLRTRSDTAKEIEILVSRLWVPETAHTAVDLCFLQVRLPA
jgi:hypothetical protein